MMLFGFCNVVISRQDLFIHWQDGSKELINGKPSSISRNAPIKQHKVSRGPAKTIAWDHGGLPPSKDNILELLHDFVNQFLSGGYNGKLLHIDRK